MDRIEVINLLTFIQLFAVFDFGLFYLDEKHALGKVYIKFLSALSPGCQKFIKRGKNRIRYGRKLIREGRRNTRSYIYAVSQAEKLIDKINNILNPRKIGYDGWALLGLYSGVYGMLCLLLLEFSRIRMSFADDILLISAEIILFIQSVVIFRMIFSEKNKFNRNSGRRIFLIIFIVALAAAFSYFDWPIRCFSNFELPFVFSLIVLVAPVAVFLLFYAFTLLRVHILRLRALFYLRGMREYNTIKAPKLKICSALLRLRWD